jgi:voltage-gated potassium channel
MTNVFVALTARHLNKDVRIIARANRKDSVLKLVRAGADHVVSPYGMVGMTAAEYIGQPVAFDAIYDLAAGGRGAILESVMILPEMVADSPTVGQLDLVQHRLQLFGVISLRTDVTEGHGGAFHLPEAHFYFNPRPDFAVHAKDILVVFGYEGSVRKFRKFLDQRRSAVQRA